jgi:hypothetical protein
MKYRVIFQFDKYVVQGKVPDVGGWAQYGMFDTLHEALGLLSSYVFNPIVVAVSEDE